MSRPAHLRPGLVALVAAGGVVGTAARYALSRAVPTVDGWPAATFVANLAGAVLLGVVLETLVRRGPETAGARRLRLGLGTGALGGFTTFSSLAIEIERLLADGRAALGVAYGLASVVLGFAGCLVGVVVSARLHGRDEARGAPADPDDAERLPARGEA